MRRKLNSPPSPTSTEPKSITGLPPAKVAVRPPRNSRIHSQPGIDGSTPRGNPRQPRGHQHQHGHRSDRHPAGVEGQQHTDARHHEEFRAGPQSMDDAVARHGPQQHDLPALPLVRGRGASRHASRRRRCRRQHPVLQMQGARAQLLETREVVGDHDQLSDPRCAADPPGVAAAHADSPRPARRAARRG